MSAIGPGELTPSRQSKGSEATRKRILDAAEAEFAAKGFDGARLAVIARAADVPQALIHHYFDDKAGLYRAVIERALGAITTEGWRILETLGPPRRRTRSKRFDEQEISALIEALVGMLVDFYASHVRVMRILQNEGERGGKLDRELLLSHAKPQLDDVVARFDEMRRRGEVRADVDARHLCMSALAMASFPYLEERFVSTMWSIDPHSEEFRRARKREITATLMSRIAR